MRFRYFLHHFSVPYHWGSSENDAHQKIGVINTLARSYSARLPLYSLNLFLLCHTDPGHPYKVLDSINGRPPTTIHPEISKAKNFSLSFLFYYFLEHSRNEKEGKKGKKIKSDRKSFSSNYFTCIDVYNISMDIYLFILFFFYAYPTTEEF